jgi:HEAT repeat protein
MFHFQTTRTIALLVALLSASWTPAADETQERLASAIRTVQQRQDTDPADAANFLAGEVVTAARDPAQAKVMEQLLIQGLAGASTRAGRDFLCRQLVMVGTEAAVPELAKLLTHAESSHIARYALTRIPGPAADAALLDALTKADDLLKIGLVNSLGSRGCAATVEPLAALVGSSNAELAAAALGALARIDDEQAVAAIAKAEAGATGRIKLAAADAYLTCAARAIKKGQTDRAMTVYQQLYAANQPSTIRVAALTGMVAAQKDRAMSVVIAALGDPDPQVRRVAIPTLREVPGAAATQAIVQELSRRDDGAQAMLLAVLSDRGDRTALGAVVQSAQSAAPAVRVAALEALAKLGDASVVALLAQRAAAADAAEQQTARNSLSRLSGEGINVEIAKQLAAGEAAVRIEAARALAVRGATDQAAALLRTAEGPDGQVAAEAVKALRALARAEQLPALIALLIRVPDGGVRGEVEQAVVAAAAAAPAGQDPAQPALQAWSPALTPEVRVSLLRVLGRMARPSALPVLTAAVRDETPEVKDAAIRALAEWPTAEPIQTLQQIAADEAASLVHRVLALRGFVNLVPKQVQMTDDQILDSYARAMQLASRVEEKQLVLSKLALVRHRRALEMVKQYGADQPLQQAAQAAALNIEKLLAAPARVTASVNQEAAGKAIDGDPGTRWDTGAAMSGGEWFRLELDEERVMTGLVLDTRGSGGDYPRGYEVYVSAGALGEGQLVAKGQGREALLKIVFERPVRGRAVKIVQTGQSQGLFWSIHELTIESQP